ncbi:hypothetical protein [Psychrobacillus sp. OK032]|uniref:hypothetical protein n=1 Tax=Psychrobacillus sp. OK032 TaxID=1884358 RepID=UPI0008C06F82|nr:hypothetical protein [Psychrobacillus sp. OK032]SES46259.1 hypothetical protein SAMN05518872_1258 [Psychrobacillus sp. OK032]
MYKKIRMVVLVAVLALGMTSFDNMQVDASTNKVMWGKTELKQGQIGKVTILADTNLVKIGSNGSLNKVRTLKKGDEYRVYTYKGTNGGLYGVGASSYVQKGSLVKYETPSKSKLALLNKEVIGGLTPKAGLKLVYSPSFTGNTQKEFTTTTSYNSEYGITTASIIFKDNPIDGFTYLETKDSLVFGVSHTDWILLDIAYPLTEGKQTKEYYQIGVDSEGFYNVNVESTTSTVKVKAGTFQNVVVVRVNNGDTYYLAPGIGIIKLIDKNGVIKAELLSFK